MTERAAERALGAIELAQPMQERLARDANVLNQRWDAWFASPVEMEQARALVLDTRGYLRGVPRQAGAINKQLLDIMMAQDFQDLTGQVIKKMIDMVNELETQLLQVLLDNAPVDIRQDMAFGLQNGPQINPEHPEALSDQAQVDDLLESLGF